MSTVRVNFREIDLFNSTNVIEMGSKLADLEDLENLKKLKSLITEEINKMALDDREEREAFALLYSSHELQSMILGLEEVLAPQNKILKKKRVTKKAPKKTTPKDSRIWTSQNESVADFKKRINKSKKILNEPSQEETKKKRVTKKTPKKTTPKDSRIWTSQNESIADFKKRINKSKKILNDPSQEEIKEWWDFYFPSSKGTGMGCLPAVIVLVLIFSIPFDGLTIYLYCAMYIGALIFIYDRYKNK